MCDGFFYVTERLSLNGMKVSALFYTYQVNILWQYFVIQQ